MSFTTKAPRVVDHILDLQRSVVMISNAMNKNATSVDERLAALEHGLLSQREFIERLLQENIVLHDRVMALENVGPVMDESFSFDEFLEPVEQQDVPRTPPLFSLDDAPNIMPFIRRSGVVTLKESGVGGANASVIGGEIGQEV